MKNQTEKKGAMQVAENFLACMLEIMRAAENGTGKSPRPKPPAGKRKSGDSLLYALYSSGDGSRYFAVCLDDPYCYASGATREAAITSLLGAVRERYGCEGVVGGVEVTR